MNLETLTLGSLFDGSGGFPLAATMCGIEPLWASEVEPYPIAVTRSRFPRMKHLGSVTDIKGAEISPVDVITFGSPCQDLSVAGKRAGLKHESNGDIETTRSGLFMEAVRIIKEMRDATNDKYPRFALWENVPGAFSSNKGEDFRIVLEELIKIVEPSAVMPAVPKKGWAYADCYSGDGWSIAYRVLDTQYWPRTPQRRRRIYLVADFGGQRAGEILFERAGLRGDFAQSGAPWQGIAAHAESGAGADHSAEFVNCLPFDTTQITNPQNGNNPGWGDPCHPLAAHGHAPTVVMSSEEERSEKAREPHQTEAILTEAEGQRLGAIGLDGYNATTTGEVAATLGVNCGMSTGRNGVVCLNPWDAQTIRQYDASGVFPALSANSGGGQNRAGVLVPSTEEPTPSSPHVTASAGFKAGQGVQARSIGYEEEKAPTLASEAGGNSVPAVCATVFDARGNGDGETVPTIIGDHNNRVTDYSSVVVALEGNGTRPSHFGDGYSEGDKMYTLNTIERHAVCYPVVAHTLPARSDGSPQPDKGNGANIVVLPIHDQATRFSGKHGDKQDGKGNGLGVGAPGDPMNTLTGGDRHAVAYLASGADVTGCLMASGYDKLGAQEMFSGDYTVVEADRPECYTLTHQGFMVNPRADGVMDALLATDHKDPPVVAIDRAAFNQGKNAQYAPQYYEDGTNPTLVARGPSAVCYWDGSQICGTLTANNAGGNQRMPDKENFNCVVENQEVHYVVRRLTPTECARLQGFPDKWGHPEKKEEFTDEEYQFWLDVRNTHAAINGKAVKDYTKEQMVKWYNKLHTDSSEYKMWGNGIALPCALYVMQGIAEACL